MHIEFVPEAARPFVAGALVVMSLVIGVWALWIRKNAVMAVTCAAAGLTLALVVFFGTQLVAFSQA